MSFLSYGLSPLLAALLALSPISGNLTASAASTPQNAGNAASGLVTGLLVGVTAITIGSSIASALLHPSFGGRVATVDACIGDGGIGEAVTFAPDARLIPLIPPTYIWTPLTITHNGFSPVPTPTPPHPGQQLLGIARPSAAVCIGLTPPFIHFGGWQMIEVGESPAI